MKNWDSHIYLYAKHWYKVTNPIDDLKVLYSLRNGIDAEYITKNNIFSCLVRLTFKHIKNERLMEEFLNDISPENSWKVWKFSDEPWDYWKAVISKCLSILSLTKVSDIEEGLDEPDYTILPSSKK